MITRAAFRRLPIGYTFYLWDRAWKKVTSRAAISGRMRKAIKADTLVTL